MKQHKRKIDPRKRFARERIAPEDSRHWLGEGALGQESLMLELDPLSFLADQALASAVVSQAHRCKRGADKPFAVLLAPDGCLGWQLSYLCKHFNVYLSSSGAEDILDRAVARFGAKAISAEFSVELEHYIDLFVFADSRWESKDAYLNAIREAAEHLSDEGKIYSILPAVRMESGVCLQWDGGGISLLEPNLFDRVSAKFTIHSVECSAAALADSGRQASFLKRNRSFFGKGVREMLSQRLRESDFAEGLAGDDSLAVLLALDFAST